MGFLLTLFSGPYGVLIKLALVTAVVGGIWLHGRSSGVDSMRPKVEAAESTALLWQKTAENRLTLMQAQNTAVAALKQASDTKYQIVQKKLSVAVLEGQKWRDAAERRADLLVNLELPENECEALKTLVDEVRK